MPPKGYGMMNRPLLENRPVATVFVGNMRESVRSNETTYATGN
jgi:hypothetical protein